MIVALTVNTPSPTGAYSLLMRVLTDPIWSVAEELAYPNVSVGRDLRL